MANGNRENRGAIGAAYRSTRSRYGATYLGPTPARRARAATLRLNPA